MTKSAGIFLRSGHVPREVQSLYTSYVSSLLQESMLGRTEYRLCLPTINALIASAYLVYILAQERQQKCCTFILEDLRLGGEYNPVKLKASK